VGPWNVEQRVVTTARLPPCGVDGCGGSKVSEYLTLLGVEPVRSGAGLLAK
jgi:heptosyltransferase-3